METVCIHNIVELDNYKVCEVCGKIVDVYLHTIDETNYILLYEYTRKIEYGTSIEGNKKTAIGRTHLKIQKSPNNSKSEYVNNILKILDIEGVYSKEIVKLVNIISEKQINRSKIKQALVLWCIFYVYKENNMYIDISKHAKLLTLESKYITKANKIIIDVITTYYYKELYHYLDDIHPIDVLFSKIPKEYISLLKYKNTAKKLYTYLNDSQVFQGHTTQSIVNGILYYILVYTYKKEQVASLSKLEQKDVYSRVFNISKPTLTVIYNLIEEKRQTENFFNEK